MASTDLSEAHTCQVALPRKEGQSPAEVRQTPLELFQVFLLHFIEPLHLPRLSESRFVNLRLCREYSLNSRLRNNSPQFQSQSTRLRANPTQSFLLLLFRSPRSTQGREVRFFKDTFSAVNSIYSPLWSYSIFTHRFGDFDDRSLPQFENENLQFLRATVWGYPACD